MLNHPDKQSILTSKRFLDEVVFTNPTLGANVEEIQYKNMKFLMWDLGGQETSRATWVNYYNGTTVESFFLSFFVLKFSLNLLR